MAGNSMVQYDLAGVVGRFAVPGRYQSGVPHGSGHINDSFRITLEVEGEPHHALLQRINHHVFRDPPAVMENILRTTRHLRAGLEAENAVDLDRRTLTVIPTSDGCSFCRDEQGFYWRMYTFIERARSHDTITSPRQAYEVGRAFGDFQRRMVDLPTASLRETIPGFHDTPGRIRALKQVMEKDPCGRVASARPEIDFALARESRAGLLLDAHRRGEIPGRVTHNDTKLNNVLINEATQEGICVIDLDTVMPGLSLFDFGDMVRTATNTGAEDERDLSRVTCSLEMFEALARGYLSQAGDILAERELELLAICGQVITLETGVRFLADHLGGDTYFKVHREGHNLDRARAQFQLVRSLEEKQPVMTALIEAARSDIALGNLRTYRDACR